MSILELGMPNQNTSKHERCLVSHFEGHFNLSSFIALSDLSASFSNNIYCSSIRCHSLILTILEISAGAPVL